MSTNGKCPCGIESYNVAITRDFGAHTGIVVKTEWWHDEYEKCPK